MSRPDRFSLRSKRFCGVAKIYGAKNGASKRREDGRGRKEGNSPHLHLLYFDFPPIFRAGKTITIPYVGLSLLSNPTETLATQATIASLIPLFLFVFFFRNH